MHMIQNCSIYINTTFEEKRKVPYNALLNINNENLKCGQRVLEEKSGIERYIKQKQMKE